MAMTLALNALKTGDLSCVTDEVVIKVEDVLKALEKKGKSVNRKKEKENTETLEKVLKFFTTHPNTLTQILTANRTELDELGVLTSQKLNAIIRPAIENGQIIREKEGKTTTFRLA